jgi:hypothetical protein
VRVIVTTADMTAGRPASPERCPVASAVTRNLSHGLRAAVSASGVRVFHPDDPARHGRWYLVAHAPLPAGLAGWIADFDAGRAIAPPPPFDLELVTIVPYPQASPGRAKSKKSGDEPGV